MFDEGSIVHMKVKRNVGFGIAALLAVVAMGGCGTLFDSNKVDYKSAAKLPPLEVPPDLTTPTHDERYAVPDVGPQGTATFSAYSDDHKGQVGQASTPTVAKPNDVLPAVDKMHVERSGTQRWLVVAGKPEVLWPTIKDFWREAGFTINVDKPDVGVMETDWSENRAKIPQDFIRRAIGSVLDGLYSTPERDKYRTRIEQGVEAGTTEIYISHRGVYEIYTNEGHTETKWQPRPADPDLEAEMLRRLMVRLGATEGGAKTQVTGVEPLPEKAKLTVADNGSGTLQLQEPFDRAWRRVGLALDRVGFTVEDRDRSQGLYFVRYVDPEADAAKKDGKSFLSKLAFWESDKPGASDKMQYRIHVKSDGANSAVEVLTREGGVEKSESAKKILGLLHEQLK
jgi:outer membrane protein assembly factor BamC